MPKINKSSIKTKFGTICTIQKANKYSNFFSKNYLIQHIN